ncbi:MAG: hypothetical protein DMG96_27730 [Acidobacteria bacterium]|nr:MAG: hypothetical protein DMG96_27730 [Acidobacteriota bacterium]
MIRKSLLADPSSGGLIRPVADKPAYLPSSGSDYVFFPLVHWRKLGSQFWELCVGAVTHTMESTRL